ncbi:Hypothetical_protein [Hexamita inflata]|uniref:Hypothetical_protein n=1 Tax=Hexamita inflata TaxID=28002 RepID=A0AA86UWI2_9EUKA|nr:Hypothetical protein HINF_LOCUS55157 [Hexamita inflata]
MQYNDMIIFDMLEHVSTTQNVLEQTETLNQLISNAPLSKLIQYANNQVYIAALHVIYHKMSSYTINDIIYLLSFVNELNYGKIAQIISVFCRQNVQFLAQIVAQIMNLPTIKQKLNMLISICRINPMKRRLVWKQLELQAIINQLTTVQEQIQFINLLTLLIEFEKEVDYRFFVQFIPLFIQDDFSSHVKQLFLTLMQMFDIRSHHCPEYKLFQEFYVCFTNEFQNAKYMHLYNMMQVLYDFTDCIFNHFQEEDQQILIQVLNALLMHDSPLIYILVLKIMANCSLKDLLDYNLILNRCMTFINKDSYPNITHIQKQPLTIQEQYLQVHDIIDDQLLKSKFYSINLNDTLFTVAQLVQNNQNNITYFNQILSTINQQSLSEAEASYHVLNVLLVNMPPQYFELMIELLTQSQYSDDVLELHLQILKKSLKLQQTKDPLQRIVQYLLELKNNHALQLITYIFEWPNNIELMFKANNTEDRFDPQIYDFIESFTNDLQNQHICNLVKKHVGITITNDALDTEIQNILPMLNNFEENFHNSSNNRSQFRHLAKCVHHNLKNSILPSQNMIQFVNISVSSLISSMISHPLVHSGVFPSNIITAKPNEQLNQIAAFQSDMLYQLCEIIYCLPNKLLLQKMIQVPFEYSYKILQFINKQKESLKEAQFIVESIIRKLDNQICLETIQSSIADETQFEIAQIHYKSIVIKNIGRTELNNFDQFKILYEYSTMIGLQESVMVILEQNYYDNYVNHEIINYLMHTNNQKVTKYIAKCTHLAKVMGQLEIIRQYFNNFEDGEHMQNEIVQLQTFWEMQQQLSQWFINLTNE